MTRRHMTRRLLEIHTINRRYHQASTEQRGAGGPDTRRSNPRSRNRTRGRGYLPRCTLLAGLSSGRTPSQARERNDLVQIRAVLELQSPRSTPPHRLPWHLCHGSLGCSQTEASPSTSNVLSMEARSLPASAVGLGRRRLADETSERRAVMASAPRLEPEQAHIMRRRRALRCARGAG